MVTREGRPTGYAILGMVGGLGLIGIAAAEMEEGCYTVRVDRAVNLDQGSKYTGGWQRRCRQTLQYWAR